MELQENRKEKLKSSLLARVQEGGLHEKMRAINARLLEDLQKRQAQNGASGAEPTHEHVPRQQEIANGPNTNANGPLKVDAHAL